MVSSLMYLLDPLLLGSWLEDKWSGELIRMTVEVVSSYLSFKEEVNLMPTCVCSDLWKGTFEGGSWEGIQGNSSLRGKLSVVWILLFIYWQDLRYPEHSSFFAVLLSEKWKYYRSTDIQRCCLLNFLSKVVEFPILAETFLNSSSDS